MFRPLIVAGLCLWLACPRCVGDDVSDLAPEVARLIKELDADTRAARVAAEKRLRELGPKILPLLPSPDLLKPGVRETLAKLRFELERRQARESVEPSRASLSGTKTVEYWLKELSRQTENPLEWSDIDPTILRRSIAFAAKESTFWELLERICIEARLEIGERSSSGVLSIRPQPKPAVTRDATALAGAFRVQVTGVQRRAGLEADEDLLRVMVRLTSEPRLRPLFLKVASRDVAASSDGRNLDPLNPEAHYEVLLAEGSRPARLQLDFRLPKTVSAKSLELKVRFQVTVAAGSEPIRFTDIAAVIGQKSANIARRRGGVTVTLQKVESLPAENDRRNLRVDARVTYDTAGPAFESHRVWLLHNRAYLQWSDGKIQDQSGLDTTEQSDGSLGAAYLFRDVPAAVPAIAFVYVAPTLIIDVPVAVALKGLHVPARAASESPESR